jgi:hypothetical protein
VFRNPIDNLQELQQAIEDTKANVAPEILSNSSNNLNKNFFFRTFSPITYFYMVIKIDKFLLKCPAHPPFL